MTVRSNQSGFTLVEVLVSLFIFSLISVGAMGALFSTLGASDRLDAAVEDLNAIGQVRAILAADFDAITPRQNRDALGGLDPVTITTQGEALISFTRSGRMNPGGLQPRGDLLRVAYYYRGGKLIRATLPHENPAQGAEWRERVILDDLDRVELSALEWVNGQIYERPNWQLRIGQDVSDVKAVAIDITTAGGVKTRHLFELGL